MAHLARRAGFGANRRELETLAADGYEATVQRLLKPQSVTEMGDDMIRRYHHEQSGMMGQNNPGAYWLYKMITSTDPLREKMALFWHGIFATGYPKITQGQGPQRPDTNVPTLRHGQLQDPPARTRQRPPP